MTLDYEIRRLRAKEQLKKRMNVILKPRHGWKRGKDSFAYGKSLIRTLRKRKIKLFISKNILGMTDYTLQVNGKTVLKERALPNREALEQINNILRNPSKVVKLAKLRKVF